MSGEELKQGEVHPFESGVVLGVSVWAAKNKAGRIHIRIAGGERFIVTVTNHQASERYHRTLFRNLRRVLIANDKWPYGDEGAETEQRTKEDEEE